MPPAVLKALAAVDVVLHAGDLGSLGVLDTLAAMGTHFAVFGNVDPREVRETLPARMLIELDGVRIGLVHGDIVVPGDNDSNPHGPSPRPATTTWRAWRSFAGNGVDCVVFGHSHRPLVQNFGRVLMFNPGSCTEPRQAPRPSFGVLTAHRRSPIEGEVLFLE
jgi:uncharacterized protein